MATSTSRRPEGHFEAQEEINITWFGWSDVSGFEMHAYSGVVCLLLDVSGI